MIAVGTPISHVTRAYSHTHPYSLTAEDAEAGIFTEEDGWYIVNIIMNILNLPLLYQHYMVMPRKTTTHHSLGSDCISRLSYIYS